MERIDNQIVWKVALAFCLLFFGVFLYFYLLRNRKHSYSAVLDTPDNDQEALSNDWKNVFADLRTVFQKQSL